MPSWECESCGQPTENEWEHTDPNECIIALLERVDYLERNERTWRDDPENAAQRTAYLVYDKNRENRYAPKHIPIVGFKNGDKWQLVGAGKNIEISVTHYREVPEPPTDYRVLPLMQ